MGNLGQFSFGSLSLSLFSLSYSWILRVFLEHSWRVWHTWIFGARRQRKGRKAQEDIGINNYNEIFLKVPSCMYVFLTSFGMHCTCMWFLGCELSLAWKIIWIDSGFPNLAISWIAMVIVGLLSFLCFGSFSCFLILG